MLLVDTNIVAYLFIAGDRTKKVHELYARDAEWKSESFLLIEFSNILATYERAGALNRAQAEDLLHDAERRLRGLVNVPHVFALRTAQRFGVSAYDARFLAAAESLDTRLVTEDVKLRAAAPGLTQSLSEALAL